MATDLEVGVEFVRLSAENSITALRQGSVDMVMSGLVMEPTRARLVRFSIPYMDVTAAFLVPDHLRHEFSNREALRSREQVRIGIYPSVRYERDLTRHYLPNAELVTGTSARPFVEGEIDLDAILLSAEEAAAWTLLYPAFSVAVPFPEWKAPVAVAMDGDASDLKGFVDAWLELAKRDGTVDRYFAYWVMGEEPPERRMPRWSILRDVLGWAGRSGESASQPGPGAEGARPDSAVAE
jgi:ABC-type amino acid transport substrate-binding protein